MWTIPLVKIQVSFLVSKSKYRNIFMNDCLFAKASLNVPEPVKSFFRIKVLIKKLDSEKWQRSHRRASDASWLCPCQTKHVPQAFKFLKVSKTNQRGQIF